MSELTYRATIPFLHGRNSFNEMMSVGDIKSVSESIIDQAVKPIEDAMLKADLQKSDIGLVLLAGGSSKLPLVSEKVEAITGQVPRLFPKNHMYAVANGASLYHRRIYQLPSDKREKRILGDGLGVLTNDGGFTGFRLLLPHNQKLPAKTDYEFAVSEDQEMVTISLRCQEGTNDNKSRPLKKKDLKLLKKAEKIKVEINVDTNRLITLTAYDPKNLDHNNSDSIITLQVNRDELSDSDIFHKQKEYGIVVTASPHSGDRVSEHPCIGIDLGTTTSELAYTNRYGEPDPKCLENEDIGAGYDSHCYPSVVFFPNGLMNPEVCNKRALDELQRNNAQANVYGAFKIEDRERPLGEINGVPITVESLSAHVIAKIWNDAKQSFLGSGCDLRSAVITVPAAFGPDECQDTYNAAKLAGIKEVTLIDEPTAAFLYYQSIYPNVSNAEIKNVLVFDFGGGTADVAILDVSEDPGVAPGTFKDTLFEVLATSGNTNCGGKHIDLALAAHMRKIFQDKHQCSLENEVAALSRIVEAAEKVKIELSNIALEE